MIHVLSLSQIYVHQVSSRPYPNTLNEGHLTLVASSLLGQICCSLATGYELLSYRVAVIKHHGSRSVSRLEAHLYPSFDI